MDDPAGERALSDPTGTETLVPEGLDAALVFVRHGETEFIVEGRFQGRAETPLSAVGERQAALTAARLAQPQASPALPLPTGPPVEIVHSPLARTAQTARVIEDAFRGTTPAERRPDPGLLEIGQGAWEGLLTTEIEARWGEVLGRWRRRPVEAWAPGGESLPEVQARVRPALAAMLGRLAAAGRDRSAAPAAASQVAGYRQPLSDRPWSVVVGHDGVFKVALLTLFALPLERFWMWSFDLCGISVIEFRGGRPLVRAMNLTEHLAPLVDEEAQQAAEARQRSGAM